MGREQMSATATRSILDEVDWDCEVLRNFSETNLGCQRRTSSGLTWAFGLVDKAIILEDELHPVRLIFRLLRRPSQLRG